MIPNEQDLMNNLGKISYMLDKAHLLRLEDDYGVLPFDNYYNRDKNDNEQITYLSNIRALRVERCVIDKEEKVADCFKNILGLFANSEDSLALVINRKPKDIEMYFVVKNIGLRSSDDIVVNIELLAESIRGNLPGTKVTVIDERDGGNDTAKLFPFDKAMEVSVLSNIPSEKSEDFVSQGIEKLLNGIVPQKDDESYTIVLLAESLPLLQVRSMLSGYEELATALAPFLGYQFQSGKNETDTKGEMESLAHGVGISYAITKTHSVNASVNGNMFSSVTKAITDSITEATTKSMAGALASTGAAVGAVIGSIVPGIGTLIGGMVGGLAGNVIGALVGSTTKGKSSSRTNADTQGTSIGGSLGYGYSQGTTDTKSVTDTSTEGTNHSLSLGTSENTTYTYKSYVVSDLIAKLEATIKRIDESKANGLWRYAAYVFSSEPKTTKNVANFLCAISQGETSFIEPAFIQTWVNDESSNDLTAFGEVRKYVRHFTHPVFGNLIDGTPVTPTSEVSTIELANVFAFPRHAVNSLPVIECVRFGREPHSYNELSKDIDIGCAYHMHQIEKNRIFLSREELKTHTFITGSTGSGKSNTIYKLIAELCPEKSSAVKFLVIEPAKGEYKDVFGGRSDVDVYGTNPFKAPNLLQINPFSFPPGIHVLEHIDRLVEVFNACWPMYAAMPAILKESVEKAYELAGWNLKTSKYIGEFPTFNTLMTVLPKVIDTSAYSADTSNDYKGALLTRVRSLTTGIQGQIFEFDIDNEALFNKNVIVDLSRVGSSETKALLMGVMVLKLQEFRMSESDEKNKKLRHITVLEEAHHLLRRTSSEQTQESSNLQGKSVEMLANAIAEMRTYGEGFIIADQSPALMDMSVIRNTNTKIILRLPDESDRMLVGKAAGLSDIQIGELSRLQCGVAAISQSGWLEPVLCKIDKFENDISMSTREYTWEDKENTAIKQFLNAAFDVEKIKLSADTADKIRKWIDRIEISDKVRVDIERVLAGGTLSGERQMLLIGGLFGVRNQKIPDRETAVTEVQRVLIGQYDFKEQDEIIRRINDLFLVHFPVNIYTASSAGIENARGGIM